MVDVKSDGSRVDLFALPPFTAIQTHSIKGFGFGVAGFQIVVAAAKGKDPRVVVIAVLHVANSRPKVTFVGRDFSVGIDPKNNVSFLEDTRLGKIS